MPSGGARLSVGAPPIHQRRGLVAYNNNPKTNAITDSLLAIMRDEYVNGAEDGEGGVEWPSARSLIAKFNVNKSTLYKKIDQQDWKGQRQRAVLATNQEIDNLRALRIARDSGRMNDACFKQAMRLIAYCESRIDHLRENAVELGAKGERSATNIEAVLRGAQKIASLALGQATEIKLERNVGDESAFDDLQRSLDDAIERKREKGGSPETQLAEQGASEPTGSETD